jgi:predicted nucleic acid-binding protein
LLAFLFGERGHDKVVGLFDKAAESDLVVLIAAPNWAEVAYQIERKVGRKRWLETRIKLLALPLEIVAVGQVLAEIAAGFKATRKMSLADCFAAALAKERACDVYTGDPEFRAVEKDVKVVWL